MKKITSMVVENFLSFGKAEFDLDEQGLVLIEGENCDDESASSNGSGKSALIDALIWCLFGVTLRGYDGDEVIHRKVGEGCVVHVRFHDGDQEWVVTRARKHPTIRNALVLMTSDGDDRSKPSARETQEEIERVLGCTRRTFLSSVVFGQDRAYRFSSLTDAEQKQVLDEVLGVERFAQACAAARAKVSEIRADLEVNRRALEKVERDRDAAEADVADLRARDAGFVAERDRKLAAEREKLAKVNEWLNKTRRFRDVEKLRESLDTAQRAVTAYERKLAKASDTDTASASALPSLQLRLATTTKLLKDSDHLGGDCPTCGQKPTKRLIALIAETRTKSDKLKAEVLEASKQRDEAAAALGIAKMKLREAREAVIQAQKTYNEAVGASADAEAWRRRKTDHMERIAEIEAEENPYAALAAKAESQYTQLAADADQLASYVGAEEERLRVAQFWVEAFGTRGLRSLLVDSSLPLLNQEAARVSRAVTGGTIQVEFSATSELKSGKSVDRFEVRVDNRFGAGSYRGNSAGERAKVDLCVGLALQRLVASRSSASFNLAIFDEVLDHLDSAAHERVVEVLSELDRDSVLVVSHNEDLRAFFPNVLTIKKRGGFSSVE